MPYAVYKKKGGVIGLDKYEVEGMPSLINGIAVYITEEQEKIAKHLIGVYTFADFQRREKTKEEKEEEIAIEQIEKIKIVKEGKI